MGLYKQLRNFKSLPTTGFQRLLLGGGGVCLPRAGIPQKTGARGDTSGPKPEGPGSPAGNKGARRAALGARTSLMRQLCEFRSRWMIHMECK